MKQEIISKIETYITAELLKNPDRSIAPDEPLISGGMTLTVRSGRSIFIFPGTTSSHA